MTFDKIKAMRNAERFLSQGKIRAAVNEYQRIVENDPKDFGTLNILGDLYVKSDDVQEAIVCFMQVADHYSKQGFAQKAIAVYNKISRLQPNSVEVSAKLAKLYQLKGSFAEARTHYTVLAEQYQRTGQKSEALTVWKQIAQLDPHNTDVYLKIAEFCWQDNQKDEAARAFTEAGQRLASQESYEKALTAFTRALEIKQYDLAALNGFATTQVKLGYADEAARTLEKILEQQPFNREILYLLIDCYLDMNNPAEAEMAVIKLVEQEPANYPKFLQLVEIYLKNNDLVAAARILSMTSEHLLVGGAPEEFLRWVNEILARDPEHLDALRLLVRFHSWQRDESEIRKSLERLAETARLHGSEDDERYALSQLILIMPHEVDYARRLQEIKPPLGTPEQEFVTTESPLVEEVQEIPNFVDFGEDEVAPADPTGELFEEYTGIVEERDPAIELESYAVRVESEEEALHILGEASFENVREEDPATETVTAAEEVAEDGTLSVGDELRLQQEIESVEFYIAQSYTDLAEKTIASLEAQFGDRPEFAELRAQLGDPIQVLLDTAKSDTEETPAGVPEEPATEVVPAGAQIDPFDDFRDEYSVSEIEDTNAGDYETHYDTATAYREMGLMEEAIREFQDAVGLVSPNDGTRRFFQCCNLLGHCFLERGMPNLSLMWFKRAQETPGLSEEEMNALTYEIGNAYELGGDLRKAADYFGQVYAVNVDYRDVSTRVSRLHGR